MKVVVVITEIIERVTEYEVVVDAGAVANYFDVPSLPSDHADKNSMCEEYLGYTWDTNFADTAGPGTVLSEGATSVSVGEVAIR